MKPVSVLILSFIVQGVGASPLFEDDSGRPLIVTIEADLQKLKYEKADYNTSTDKHIDGTFRLDDKAYSISLQTRGHDRLSRCTFPSLRVRFQESDIENSILEDNDNLKLVTHCEMDQLEMLYREYLVYRLYSLITPYSFQVRMLKIRYVDTNGRHEPIESYAFFIESDNSIEKRLNLNELKSDQDFNMKTYDDISEHWLNVSQTSLLNAFQHFIRNNDWVVFYTHSARSLSAANIKFFHDDKQGFPFPYDFDLAGLVTRDSENYQYRYGAEHLCQTNEMKSALKTILRHEVEYFELLNRDSMLSTSYKTDLAAYLDEFRSAEASCVKAE